MALVASSASAMATGCYGNDESPTPTKNSEKHDANAKSGSVGLDLQVGSGTTLTSATYTITGPGGYTKSNTIDISNSPTLSFVVGGIPAGQGFNITVSATTADATTTCSGSGAPFNVTASATTQVTVALDCHEPAKTGSVLVNGTTNVCPVADGISANPAAVFVGGTVALDGLAHDSDNGPSPLTYTWSASTGTLSSTSAKSPTFTCTVPGPSTITLTVSDGDTSAGCANSLTATVQCTLAQSGVVTASAFVAGSSTEPTVNAGYYQGATVCVDANDNGHCDSGEASATTDANGRFTVALSSNSGLIADIGTSAVNTATSAANPKRNVFRVSADQIADQGANLVVSSLSSEVVRQMEANSSTYATEKQNLATRLGVPVAQVLADPSSAAGATKSALLREANVLSGRFAYAITKLDRGDKYPDALAFPGGNPEITGMSGVTPATATTVDTRAAITFKQSQQAAFAVEGIPRYDHIFIVMLENKSTQAIFNSTFAPKINAYLSAGNFASSYYATGNPSEPNYTALGGGDDFGITDDSQWNCDATGANAVQDLPVPDNTVPGLASSPFTTTCTQSVHTNHNIVGKPNLFNAVTAAGMTWRTYSESMNPGQDFRTDSVADPAVTATDHVYQPGTINGNTAVIGNANLTLPLPGGLYKTKHHPGMAYQNVRSAPEFKYSNRTLGGGQWDTALAQSTKYTIPQGYDTDQLGTDLGNGGVGTLNFVIPDQCDDMHGISVTGTISGGGTGTASDCSSVNNNVNVATGGNIIARGDNYVGWLVNKIQTSAVWTNTQKKVAIVLMFDEGNSTTNLNSCCGWKAGKNVTDNPLVQNPDSTWSPDTSNAQYNLGNKGHGKSIFVVLTNQPNAPKHIADTDVYSHFSFVRTLQDMFALGDPASDASYMNRAKYTEKFIAQNILNLPEFAGSADTHFDSVRPMNHAFVIPAGYQAKATDDDTRPLQVGPDANQVNIWSIK
jgi:hypothetical protein